MTGQSTENITAMTRSQRTRALGQWGERKAAETLARAGFDRIRDLNAHRFNHPFGDLVAQRDGLRFLIGVRTRNKWTANGSLNAAYNICKKSADPAAVAAAYKAEPAWVTVQVEPERQRYSCYFGTMAQLTANGERYSVPMTATATASYEYLAYDELDRRI